MMITTLTNSMRAAIEAMLPRKIALADCEITTYGALVSPDCDSPDDDSIVVLLPGYRADDGNAEVTYDWAESGREAAQEYADSGDWGERDETSWVEVRAWRTGYVVVSDGDKIEVAPINCDEDTHTVEIEADEPECDGDGDEAQHDWQSPHSVLGGLRENPGVQGHGGGVIIEECCAHCGRYRVTDTWAQNSGTGEQGLTSVGYRPADESSAAWLASRADA